MTEERKKIVEYAKKLYLKYNDSGERLYSLHEIATKVQQKYNTKTNKTTIRNWSENYDWNKINEKIKIHSIAKAKDSKITSEERIIEAKSDDLAEIYKQSLNVFRASAVAFKKSFDANKLSAKDALQGLKMASEILLRINEIPENVTIKNEINLSELGTEELLSRANAMKVIEHNEKKK